MNLGNLGIKMETGCINIINRYRDRSRVRKIKERLGGRGEERGRGREIKRLRDSKRWRDMGEEER